MKRSIGRGPWMLPLVVVVAAACQTALRPVDPTASSEPEFHVYREVGGRSLAAYVFRPPGHRAGSPAAGILLFHGGGWTAGEPAWTFASARRFAAQGLVAIPVEYRLSGGAVTPIEALDDACAAFRWARRNAARLGLDPARVAGHGVSAGGHLIAATVTVGCPPQDDPTRAGPDALLLWSAAVEVGRSGYFRDLLQGRASASDYSPAQHVRPTTPPASIVQGERDSVTPLWGAELFCERIVEQGNRCDLHVYPGLGHLLTRNLEHQEDDFDRDPEARADGIDRHERFLESLGFLPGRRRDGR